MTVLGINGGFRQGYQDISACLLKDGKVLAAIEEERLDRVKFSGGHLPFLSIIEVLKIGNITIEDVDFIAFHGETWGSEIDIKIKSYFEVHFGFAPPLKRFHHHDCHAAATFYSSGFDQALVVTMDNSGDGISLQIAIGKNGTVTPLKRYSRPQSLGVFYSLITQYCGFKKDSDEYKLMGLAAYGDKDRFDFSWLMDFNDGQLQLNTNYIVTVHPLEPSLHRDEMNFNENFIEKIGRAKRLPSDIIDQFYKDVAASAQQHLEVVMIKMLNFYFQQTGISKFCTAGGVALNCLMNQKIMNADFVDDLFVQPASSDAGISLGAAFLATNTQGIALGYDDLLYLGNAFTNDEIKEVLDICHIHYEFVLDPAKKAAEMIAADKVIGWFQGRMEFGPRALGNRSILANPCVPNIQSVINHKIKFRDSFRPFGASVLDDEASEYFDGNCSLRNYMTINFQTKDKYQKKLAGITHVDGSSRIHKVFKEQNELYYSLLQHLKQLIGVGVCLNTSFNLSHEPIVNTPQNAISTFYGSGLDALFIGNYLIVK